MFQLKEKNTPEEYYVLRDKVGKIYIYSSAKSCYMQNRKNICKLFLDIQDIVNKALMQITIRYATKTLFHALYDVIQIKVHENKFFVLLNNGVLQIYEANFPNINSTTKLVKKTCSFNLKSYCKLTTSRTSLQQNTFLWPDGKVYHSKFKTIKYHLELEKIMKCQIGRNPLHFARTDNAYYVATKRTVYIGYIDRSFCWQINGYYFNQRRRPRHILQMGIMGKHVVILYGEEYPPKRYLLFASRLKIQNGVLISHQQNVKPYRLSGDYYAYFDSNEPITFLVFSKNLRQMHLPRELFPKVSILFPKLLKVPFLTKWMRTAIPIATCESVFYLINKNENILIKVGGTIATKNEKYE